MGREFERVGAEALEMGPLAVEVAVDRALDPPPTIPPVTPPRLFVAPPAVFFAAPVPFVIAFLAPLTWFPPGYLFAPSGIELVGFLTFVDKGLLEAGEEFERLIAGLRAVEGRAFGEGWYVWPDMEEP